MSIDANTINIIAAKVVSGVKKAFKPLYDKPLYTTTEAAQFLGVKRSYLYELLRDGKIPYSKSRGGKLTYIKREDLLAWATEHTYPETKKKK